MKRRYSNGNLRPYNKRTGNGTKVRRRRKIALHISTRKVVPGG